MRVNGIDARRYNAKQLTVDIQPPKMAASYEWMPGAVQPTEFRTDVAMGHLKLCMYFRGSDRGSIVRSMSEFMSNFTKSCELELDGYKGKYRGFLKADDFKKTLVKERYKLNLEFDGYFCDGEVVAEFDGVTEGSFLILGSRNAPCIVEVYAKSRLSDYSIKGLGDDDIKIQFLDEGETAIIDGIKGKVTISGANAFERVDIWEFPSMRPGEMRLSFSSDKAKVSIRYQPMWI